MKLSVKDKSHFFSWEQRNLIELANRVIVGLATSVTPYYRETGVPLLRNMNLKKNYLDDSDLLFLDESYANSNESKKIFLELSNQLLLIFIKKQSFANIPDFIQIVIN